MTRSAPLPTSDWTSRLWPPGPTSRMSRSPGKECDMPRKLSTMPVIEAGPPDTCKVDGYGLAGPDEPLPGMAIEPGLQNSCANSAGDATATLAASNSRAWRFMDDPPQGIPPRPPLERAPGGGALGAWILACVRWSGPVRQARR